jgi:hypothetical protein
MQMRNDTNGYILLLKDLLVEENIIHTISSLLFFSDLKGQKMQTNRILFIF